MLPFLPKKETQIQHAWERGVPGVVLQTGEYYREDKDVKNIGKNLENIDNLSIHSAVAIGHYLAIRGCKPKKNKQTKKRELLHLDGAGI